MPVYFHNGSHYDFTFIMKLIASMNEDNGNLEVIPITEDKEMQIEFHGIQFKDPLKLINSPLKTIVLRHLGMIWRTINIPRLNSDAIARNGTNNGVTNTLIC